MPLTHVASDPNFPKFAVRRGTRDMSLLVLFALNGGSRLDDDGQLLNGALFTSPSSVYSQRDLLIYQLVLGIDQIPKRQKQRQAVEGSLTATTEQRQGDDARACSQERSVILEYYYC